MEPHSSLLVLVWCCEIHGQQCYSWGEGGYSLGAIGPEPEPEARQSRTASSGQYAAVGVRPCPPLPSGMMGGVVFNPVGRESQVRGVPCHSVCWEL